MDQIDKVFNEWLEKRDLGIDAEILNEETQRQRYSIEVNYRTKSEEVLDNFAKLVLGYVSAGMKHCGYHTKIVFTDKPFRVIIATRNFDAGEWVGIVCFNHKGGYFVTAKGYYNKDRKTVSIQSNSKCSGKSASEIVREMRNIMEKLKKEEPRPNELKPANLKRGPKPVHLKKPN